MRRAVRLFLLAVLGLSVLSTSAPSLARPGGGQGFSVSGPSMAAEGDPGNENEITSSSSLGIAPFAYILAFAMPRIELTLGMEKATGFEALEKAIPSGIADRAAELLSKTTIGSQIADVVKKSIKSEAEAAGFAALDLDAAVVVSYGHILTRPFLEAPATKRLGVVLEFDHVASWDHTKLGGNH